MEQDRTLDSNFWTAFADLMLALVLVLCLLLFLVMAVISYGTVNLKPIENKQRELINLIVNDFKANRPTEKDGLFTITIDQNGKLFDIQVKNYLDTQKFTFSDRLLFQPDDYRLNEEGQDTLRSLGKVIVSQSNNIKEIQIQGHADIRRSKRFPSATGNTELAALRALEVYKFFQNEKQVGIDPAKILMSVTSFGEFLPVNRDKENTGYNSERLIADNNDISMMDKNRRIEILLTYRR